VTAPPVESLLHVPVLALVRQYGAPRGVRSADDGTHVVFDDGPARIDAIVDDAGEVHAVDLAFPSGTTYTLTLDDGLAHRLTFGTTTADAAGDALSADAETEGGAFRVFRRGADSDAVLVFDASTQTLAHVIVGDRATLLRLGYVRTQLPEGPVFPFRAPVLRHTTLVDLGGTRATVLRLDVDRLGVVRDARVLIPSGDAAFDERAARSALHDTYAPATLSDRPIGATVLRELHH